MAKATKTEKIETKTVTKTAKAPAKPVVPAMSFGAWLATARARGEAGELVKAMKADKKITEKTTLKYATEKYGTNASFATVKARYELFAKRGSQAGTRSRAAA